jgi:hypothetical protein
MCWGDVVTPCNGLAPIAAALADLLALAIKHSNDDVARILPRVVHHLHHAVHGAGKGPVVVSIQEHKKKTLGLPLHHQGF